MGEFLLRVTGKEKGKGLALILQPSAVPRTAWRA